MPKLRFTKTAIERLRTSEPTGTRYYDEELTGLALRVFPSGKRIFFLEYWVAGRRRRMTLGPFGVLTVDEARRRARIELGKSTQGEDPQADKLAARAMPTFKEWVDETYMADVRARKKSIREDERYLKAAKDAFGPVRLSDITPADIAAVYHRFTKEGHKIAANRFRASVSACLARAWRDGYIEANPCLRVKPDRKAETEGVRTRVLTDDELGRVLDEVEKIENPHVKAAFVLLLHTGCRLSEALRATWSDFDLTAGRWTIPSTKSGKPQVVPLSEVVVEMLKKVPHTAVYVAAGADPDVARTDLKKPWTKLCKDAKLPDDVHLHDLRRSYGLAIAREAGIAVASKLLTHSDIRVTAKHYSPFLDADLREAQKKRDATIINLQEKRKKKAEEG